MESEAKQWLPRGLTKAFVLLAGFVLPLVAIIVEMTTRMCAEIFFDPLPTWGHVFLVWVVPLVNGYILWFVFKGERPPGAWALPANASVIGIAFFYVIAYAPLTPLAVIAIIYAGLGLLPLAPLFSLIAALMMRRWLKSGATPAATGWDNRVWPGVALAFLALLIAEAPGLATRIGARRAVAPDAATRNSGVALIRRWGSEEWLLRSCYDRSGRADMLGFLLGWQEPLTTEQARQVYYAVTGRAADSAPPPAFLADNFTFDEQRDFNDNAAGAVIKGLSLNASQMDGSLDGEAALGYLEWTMVFKNANQRQEEARAHIQLPDGAVVSRLTLWINGEEREAAFAGRGQVTQAYEQVVSRRRDPVLVTTAGPGRVQMRCFPVPPGGEMKIRIGLTTPLHATFRTLRLPYFVERNFSVNQVLHNVWLESRQPLEQNGVADNKPNLWSKEKTTDGAFALRGSIADSELSASSQAFESKAHFSDKGVWAEDKRGKPGHVVQRRENIKANIRSLVLVVDTSRAMREAWPAIINAVKRLPDSKMLTVLFTGGNGVNEDMASPQTFEVSRELAAAFLEEYTENVGGADNVAALETAWDIAARHPNGAIVWLHGPQPILAQPLEALRQRWERRPDGPQLYAVQVVAGPDRITAGLDGISACHSLSLPEFMVDLKPALVGGIQEDDGLTFVRRREAGPTGPPAGDFVKTSDHLARLWAADEVNRLLAVNKPAEREAALKLAVEYQIVTPVSGAVVLETKEQYDQNNLKPVDANTVPTIPEPEMVLLLAVTLLLLAVAVWRKQF
jgi:hypothetical protein